MYGKQIKYLRNGFTMWKMIYEFDKRLICIEMTHVYGKLLKSLRNG